MKFSLETLLDLLLNTDACCKGSAASEYLDSLGIHDTFEYQDNRLTLEIDGEVVHFDVTYKRV